MKQVVYFVQDVSGLALGRFPASIIDDVAYHALQEELAKMDEDIDGVTVRVSYMVTVNREEYGTA